MPFCTTWGEEEHSYSDGQDMRALHNSAPVRQYLTGRALVDALILILLHGCEPVKQSPLDRSIYIRRLSNSTSAYTEVVKTNKKSPNYALCYHGCAKEQNNFSIALTNATSLLIRERTPVPLDPCQAPRHA
jgi:hypothetical protein